ncbi:manganese transport system membrane protein MntC [Thermaurantimonas aggregans]|uniref:Manganese transport system membrane protein MntC n=1 Tax=Thermaurantimonas aggregans TaxID=2173829 RepID=A0A401XHW5_9FLAO|nr:metal ABC transporter permease [Thermaurantimonas aggregans]MCX8149785.1 metal ABC transporter permease [Thermaurantimonas aggregans]GCD76595.1 manganese transport system membrane protein MntC [Thermaurantimonas aggregans]
MLEPNFLWVTAGSIFLSLASSAVGTHYFLQKKSLSGDVISHALLPGVVLAFLLFGQKSFTVLFVGSFLSGLLSVVVMQWVLSVTFIKPDVSMAVVLTAFYGFGIVLLTYANKLPLGNQAGLDTFLFGRAAALTPGDVQAYAILALIILGILRIIERPLITISFDSLFAEAAGMNVHAIHNIIVALIISAVVLGVKAVGVVLMSAFIILPPFIARLLVDNYNRMKLIAALSGVFMALVGSTVSYYYSNMPTGPVMVIVGGGILILIIVIKNLRLKIRKYLLQLRSARQIQLEDLLKHLYKLEIEENTRVEINLLISSLLGKKGLFKNKTEVRRTIHRAIDRGMISRKGNLIALTDMGLSEAMRIVRLHRLWEVYQASKLGKRVEAIHASAETIEHIIPKNVEEMLIQELQQPQKDPHGKNIPYDGH